MDSLEEMVHVRQENQFCLGIGLLKKSRILLPYLNVSLPLDDENGLRQPG